MRWPVFFVIQFLIVLGIGGVFYIHQDHVVVLKKPPQSIAGWYKPQNKRQVWLHTMFKLRRELQAVKIYAKQQDSENLQKWAGKLDKDYRKIADMVPEWQNKLDLNTLAELQTSATKDHFQGVIHATESLEKNCQSCHTDFRAVTATLYRVPDFSNMKVADSISLTSHMRTLSEQVNRIKIAYVDGKDDAALAAFSQLKSAMSELGATCTNCHRKALQAYPNGKMVDAMAKLEQSLQTGALKDKGRALGTLAVTACAKCHATHRLAYDSKQLFSKKQQLNNLFMHSF
jgi:cytochrome c556